MGDEQIMALLDEGDLKAEAEDLDGALAHYQKALDLIPRPLMEQEIATEVLCAMGDVFVSKGAIEKAQEAFSQAMQCPGAADNAYIRLRRGQVAFELGDMEQAKTELACAYMSGGEEIFESEDPKYWAFIAPMMKGASE